MKSVKWEGSPFLPVRVHHNCSGVLEGIHLLPFKIVRVHQDYCYDYYIRKEGLLGQLSLVSWLLQKVVNWVRSEIGYRIIWTLQVWGLAYVQPGEIPSLNAIGKKKKY